MPALDDAHDCDELATVAEEETAPWSRVSMLEWMRKWYLVVGFSVIFGTSGQVFLNPRISLTVRCIVGAVFLCAIGPIFWMSWRLFKTFVANTEAEDAQRPRIAGLKEELVLRDKKIQTLEAQVTLDKATVARLRKQLAEKASTEEAKLQASLLQLRKDLTDDRPTT